MVFEKLSEKHIEDAVKLAQAQYDIERKHIEALYEKNYKEVLTEMLSEFFKKNYGLAAVENGNLVGYMGFWGGIEGFFGNVKGAFSPLFGNAYSGKDRGKLASLLFQYASEQMVKEEIFCYGICAYGHDIEVMKALTLSGFGIRCSDAVRSVDKSLNIKINSEYSYEEIHYREARWLLPLANSLVMHLGNSPTYFPARDFTEESFLERCYRKQSRIFTAKDKYEIIGYLEITKDGETFISEESDMLNICGAYLKEEYRGKNILQSLLALVFETLQKEGVKRLGVDCETLNPAALRFWGKYFDNYTYSFVRRIDERILK
jgi:ribosomal protein S18 acetylase RimI-like enzyme